MTLATTSAWRHALDLLVPPTTEPTDLELDYERWLRTLFPTLFAAPFAAHHHELWRWVWSIQPSIKSDAYVGIWARGGAKSTSAEAAVVSLGARKVRRYGLYLCMTQDKADDHVANIGSMLESPGVARHYPLLADRDVTKFGHSRGWRRNRLRTASKFTVDAIGLDSAARGAKLEDARPDFLVIDDIDDDQDSPAAVAKKVKLLTRKVLPAGANNLAVLAIQNLIHDRSVFSQLSVSANAGGADFMAGRVISGPVPAVRDLTVEQVADRWTIVGGEATWAGQDLAVCQAQIDEWGISAFLSEAQHDVKAPPGGMYVPALWRRCRPDQVPDLVRIVVWMDPAVTNTDDSDSQGIQADGISADDTIYRLRSWERRSSPQEAFRKALLWAVELGADHVGVETDQGGATWDSVYREACWDLEAHLGRDRGGWRGATAMPGFTYEKAGEGHGSKAHRSQRMLADYQRPGRRIVHVIGCYGPSSEGLGETHHVLERALERFPKTAPLDLADTAYWSWRDLREGSTAGRLTTYRHEGARR